MLFILLGESFNTAGYLISLQARGPDDSGLRGGPQQAPGASGSEPPRLVQIKQSMCEVDFSFYFHPEGDCWNEDGCRPAARTESRINRAEGFTYALYTLLTS